MSDSLSHRQFADYIIEHGGGSRRYSDGTIGPAQGYYVSRDPNKRVSEGGSREWVRAVRDVPRLVGRHWALTQKEALAATPDDRKSEVYQGGWASNKDSKSGKSDAYLDVSDRHDDVMDAAFAAIKNKQHAIYNANVGGDIKVWNKDRSKWSASGVADEVKRIIRTS